MSHWLHDPDSLRQVRLAPGRSARPKDVDSNDGEVRECPFCAPPGEQTPPELDRVVDDSGQWLVRTVPNRYPAFDRDDGTSEVVIESPEHITRFIDLPLANAAAAITQWARRVAHWSEDPRFSFQMFFKNEGAMAGASLQHVHSQIVALKDSPEASRRVWQSSNTDWRLGRADRTVLELGDFIALSPVAPRFAGETWISFQETGHDFADLGTDPGAAKDLAMLLQALLQALHGEGVESYNLMLMQPDQKERRGGHLDWRIEVAPRLAVMAGFELATGAYINTISPEESAEKLRKAILAHPKKA